MEERESLSRVLARKDVLALAFGTMIGWGWVMLAASWVASAGVGGAVLAFLIGGIMCVFVGLTYAELTPMLPLAGGEMVFAYRGMGYGGSWITGWAISFAYIGVAAFESVAISTAIDYLFPIPKLGYLWTLAQTDVYLSWASIGIIGSIFLTVLNIRGAKPSAVFQGACTVGLAVIGLTFVIGGFAGGDARWMTPAFTSAAGLVTVLIMAPGMYVGFDVIPQAAEEMNIPLNAIAKVLLLSIVLAVAWYILIILGVSMSAPPDFLKQAKIPVADAMGFNFGSSGWAKVMILGGIFGIVTSWNGFFIGGSRVIFAMGRAKMLPELFGRVHPKYGTPYAAIYLIGALCCLSPVLGRKALVWLIDAASLGTICAYFLVALSFVLCRKKEPALERPYKVAGGGFVGPAAVIITFAWLMLFMPFSPGKLVWPFEWGIVIIWIVIGIVFAIWGKKNNPDVGLDEREYLIFGEKYARKWIWDGEKN
jgi:APA family basic amino acid/polyamine antiporter